jgi:hypothetical protein
MTMKIWRAVIAFIEQRHPEFPSAMKGLSDNDMAALPASYVGFLTLNFGSRDPKAVKTLRQQLLTNPLIQSK